MSFEVNCKADIKNTGVSQFCQDMGPIFGYILTPQGFSVSETEGKTITPWQTGISAAIGSRIYPFPIVFSHTDNSEDTVFEEGALGNLFVRDGKTVWQFTHDSSRYIHAALKTHSLQDYGVIFIDKQGRMHGVENDDGELEAIDLQQFVVERLMPNNGTDAAVKTTVSMIFEDSLNYELNPAVLTDLEFSAKSLTGLIDLNLSDASGTTLEAIVTVLGDRTGTAFAGDVDDFEIKTSAGVVLAATSVTSEDGVHTFVMPADPGLVAGDYTIDLVDPADMTTTGYASTGAAEFTVAAG